MTSIDLSAEEIVELVEDQFATREQFTKWAAKAYDAVHAKGGC